MATHHGNLPHQAKGIDLGPVLIRFGIDKLILQAKDSPNEHITVQFGNNRSGTFDIHRTESGPGEVRTHIPIYKTAKSNLEPILDQLGEEVLHTFRSAFRPLRPGWMIRNGIGAVVLPSSEPQELENMTWKHHQRLIFDPEKMSSGCIVPETIEDLYQLTGERLFVLISYRGASRPRQIGYGFVAQDRTRKRRLYWVRGQWLSDALNRLGAKLVQCAMNYDISTPG